MNQLLSKIILLIFPLATGCATQAAIGESTGLASDGLASQPTMEDTSDCGGTIEIARTSANCVMVYESVEDHSIPIEEVCSSESKAQFKLIEQNDGCAKLVELQKKVSIVHGDFCPQSCGNSCENTIWMSEVWDGGWDNGMPQYCVNVCEYAPGIDACIAGSNVTLCLPGPSDSDWQPSFELTDVGNSCFDITSGGGDLVLATVCACQDNDGWDLQTTAGGLTCICANPENCPCDDLPIVTLNNGKLRSRKAASLSKDFASTQDQVFSQCAESGQCFNGTSCVPCDDEFDTNSEK